MNPIYGYMYTRPGNLWQEFEVLREESENHNGYLKNVCKRTGETAGGILSVAGSNDAERTKHLWNQDQHSLTHILSTSGKADVRKGDRLINDEKAFLVLTTDNLGMVGGSSILYLEERNDLK